MAKMVFLKDSFRSLLQDGPHSKSAPRLASAKPIFLEKKVQIQFNQLQGTPYKCILMKQGHKRFHTSHELDTLVESLQLQRNSQSRGTVMSPSNSSQCSYSEIRKASEIVLGIIEKRKVLPPSQKRSTEQRKSLFAYNTMKLRSQTDRLIKQKLEKQREESEKRDTQYLKKLKDANECLNGLMREQAFGEKRRRERINVLRIRKYSSKANIGTI